MKLEDIISKDLKNVLLRVGWPIFDNLVHCFGSDKPRKSITQEDWFYLVENIRCGDVLLSTGANRFSNLLLPGKAKHAAMILADNKRFPLIVESVTSGVRIIPLYDFLRSKEHVSHFRTKIFGAEIVEKAVQIAHGMLGTPYDRAWSPNNNWVYCSELVYESYKKAYLNVLSDIKPGSFPLRMKVRCGEDTYIPDDIRLDTVHWEVLWSNTK